MRELLASDVAKDVYDILLKYDTSEDKMLSVLQNIVNDYRRALTVSITIDENLLNIIRDIAWYNYERDEKDDTLKSWGSKLTQFMTFEDTIPINKVDILLDDINKVIACLSDAVFIELSGEEKNFMTNTPVWIHTGDTKRSENNKISTEMIHCKIIGSLSARPDIKIPLEGMLRYLVDACEQAQRKNVSIHIEEWR